MITDKYEIRIKDSFKRYFQVESLSAIKKKKLSKTQNAQENERLSQETASRIIGLDNETNKK